MDFGLVLGVQDGFVGAQGGFFSQEQPKPYEDHWGLPVVQEPQVTLQPPSL